MGYRMHPDVTLVSRIFAPESAAASFRLEALVKALADAGTKVDVLTTIPAPGTDRRGRSRAEELLEADAYRRSLLRVRRVQAKRDKTGYIRGYLSYLSFDIPAFFRLLLAPAPRVYVNEPPPTTGAVLRLVAALKRRPYVYYAADIWSDAAAGMDVPRWVVWALRTVEQFALRGASRVLTVTPQFAKRCKELGALRVAVVRNGIDTEVFTDTGAAPEAQAVLGANPEDGEWLVYAGTASEWQGAEVFVEAFGKIVEEFPRARLLFIGQGAAWESLQKATARLAPDKVFFGQVGAEQAAAWQRAAKACLVSIRPSQGYEEAYPTKVFSALACGTPVIYAGSGPAADDIRKSGLGLACDWEATAVAEAMRTVLSGTRQFSGLREWVLNNHSLANTGSRAAKVVLETAKL
ncbi:MAG: glycosyltransferase family 4 protein [Mobiluncus porci]|uniref:glycosyltransferase family 4 protein n=1 Tax=Mobiluncus porci TaxID=2652278 RepID=UPI0023EFF4EE|nr:glycosyltransferase family 4 protein [Mobiluncus porci]MDD7542520.1 glycosyltransferase family 4 protein [Mobiluncus porci]MDY5748817.1 glycosyltransferase family 4 protein [Mobiluncus porci]